MSSIGNTSSNSSSVNRQSEQLLALFEPIIYELENQIQSVSASQELLNTQLDSLLISVNNIKSNPDLSLVLEDKTKKILSLKRRLTLIHTIIQNANDRCRKLGLNYKLKQTNP